MAILYVDASHPSADDDTPKAGNSASSPWATIGRAAWGSEDRDNPVPAQAADDGDTVIIAAGTYIYEGDLINDRFSCAYNPVNSGAAGNLITFVADGEVVLGAPGANAPVIGAYLRDYIKWYADVTQGHAWVITADGMGGGTTTTSPDPTWVNTRPDTGPVVLSATVGSWIEGCRIVATEPVDYDDNWNAIRMEGATDCMVRNNYMEGFQKTSAISHNCSGITTYYCDGCIIEHNEINDCFAGIFLKSNDWPRTAYGQPNHPKYDEDGNNIIRYNFAHDGHAGIILGQNPFDDDEPTQIYQNLIVRMTQGFDVLELGHHLRTNSNVFFVNNTLVDCTRGISIRSDSAYWELDFDSASGTFDDDPRSTENGGNGEPVDSLSFSGGATATVSQYINNGATGTFILRFKANVTLPADNETITGSFTGVTALVNGTPRRSTVVARKLWNNIVEGCTDAINAPAAKKEEFYDHDRNDFEHNVYANNGEFADLDSEGAHRVHVTLTNWQGGLYVQDVTSPASISTDPGFEDKPNDDYRLQVGSPALTIGRVINSIGGVDGSTIPAGCYITGDEVIGLGAADAPQVTSARIHRRLVGGGL
jgi:hypothetical protein